MPYRPTRNQRERKQVRNKERYAVAEQVRRYPFCDDCGTTEDLTAEHSTPVVEGGTADQGMTTLCRACNAKRWRAWSR